MADKDWYADDTISICDVASEATSVVFTERSLRRVIDRELSRGPSQSMLSRWLRRIQKSLGIESLDRQQQIHALVRWAQGNQG